MKSCCGAFVAAFCGSALKLCEAPYIVLRWAEVSVQLCSESEYTVQWSYGVNAAGTPLEVPL